MAALLDGRLSTAGGRPQRGKPRQPSLVEHLGLSLAGCCSLRGSQRNLASDDLCVCAHTCSHHPLDRGQGQLLSHLCPLRPQDPGRQYLPR